MLEFPEKRPDKATTIYIPDANLSMIEQQLKTLSPRIEESFEVHGGSITLQEPTQAKLAGWVLYMPGFYGTFSLMNKLTSSIKRNLTMGARILDFDMDSKKIAVSIEDYQPSAYIKTRTFEVANLSP